MVLSGLKPNLVFLINDKNVEFNSKFQLKRLNKVYKHLSIYLQFSVKFWLFLHSNLIIVFVWKFYIKAVFWTGKRCLLLLPERVGFDNKNMMNIILIVVLQILQNFKNRLNWLIFSPTHINHEYKTFLFTFLIERWKLLKIIYYYD